MWSWGEDMIKYDEIHIKFEFSKISFLFEFSEFAKNSECHEQATVSTFHPQPPFSIRSRFSSPFLRSTSSTFRKFIWKFPFQNLDFLLPKLQFAAFPVVLRLTPVLSYFGDVAKTLLDGQIWIAKFEIQTVWDWSKLYKHVVAGRRRSWNDLRRQIDGLVRERGSNRVIPWASFNASRAGKRNTKWRESSWRAVWAHQGTSWEFRTHFRFEIWDIRILISSKFIETLRLRRARISDEILDLMDNRWLLRGSTLVGLPGTPRVFVNSENWKRKLNFKIWFFIWISSYLIIWPSDLSSASHLNSPVLISWETMS